MCCGLVIEFFFKFMHLESIYIFCVQVYVECGTKEF
jgi:hypothetical protein